MLNNIGQKRLSSRPGAKLLIVHGRRFSNAAAKFWSTLIDELTEGYPACRKIALAAVHEGALDSSLLYPEIELQRELDLLELDAQGARGAWQEALAELELYGPPGAVSLQICMEDGERKSLALPMDCVDAEIFLYLVAWLLEWSEVPFHSWHEDRLKGAFPAGDPLRKFSYNMQFVVEREPLKEGLYAWRLEIQYERSSSRSGILPPASLEAQSTQR